MFDAIRSGNLYFLLAAGIVLFLFFAIVYYLWIFGGLGKLLRGIDKKAKEKEAYKSIPELREIVHLYPKEKISIEAKKLLEEWDNVIKPSLKTMKQGERRKELASLYQGDIYPILKARKDIKDIIET
jgi:hypothetical protein